MSTQLHSPAASRDDGRLLARPISWLAGALSAGVLLGALLAGAPRATVLGVAAVGAALLVMALGRRSPRTFLLVLAVLLGGYIFFGRGLAHVGMRPLYVSEVVLLLGLAFFLQQRRFLRVLNSPVTWALIASALWGAARTVPYLGTYGSDALRDAVVWGYSAFALMVCAFLLESGLTEQAVLRFFRPLLWPIVASVSFVMLLLIFRPGAIPHSRLGVPLLEVRPTDLATHLAAAFAFVFLGLHRDGSRPRLAGGRLLWLIAWTAAFLLVATRQRGAMLIVLGTLAVLALNGGWRRWIVPLLAGSLILGAMAITDFRVELGKQERSLSAGQLIDNVKSVFGVDTQRGLERTKGFRLIWWKKIVGYTFFGPHFLTGKGYGVNLADADDAARHLSGFTIPLRHPHNAHLNILGRSGVPGLALWWLTQAVFLFVMARAFLTYKALGMDLRRRLTLFVGAYWFGYQINMLSNGVLISPQTGIWFWSITGAGMALAMGVGTAHPRKLGARTSFRSWRDGGTLRFGAGSG